MKELSMSSVYADDPARRLLKQPLNTAFAKRLAFFGVAMLLLLLAVEMLVFNFQSYRLLFGSYTPVTYDMSEITVTGLQEVKGQPGVYQAKSNRPTLEIKVDGAVGVVRLDVESRHEDRYILLADILYTDEAHHTYIESPAYMEILRETPRTQYKTCYFSGKTDMLKLRLHANAGETLVINGIQINHAVPMQVSAGRLIFLWVMVMGVYIFLKAPSFRKAYTPTNRVHRWTPVIITGLFLFTLWGLFALYTTPYIHIPTLFETSVGDQITKELVDAFEAGQISLLEEPSADLLGLAHPYEWNERVDANVYYLWDHLLYEGKYYSYYGIAPVLTLALPFHLLTGYYISTQYTCLLYSLLGAAFLAAAYCRLIRHRWFSRLPLRLTMSGLILILFVSGIQFSVYRPLFYEVAESCGFMFFTIGLYWLASSGLLGDKPIRLYRLVLSAVSISLAVLSRPTFALYAVVAVIWLWFGLKPYRRQQADPTRKWPVVKYGLAALLPYVLFGGLQMAYNYARFGSVLEFGIQYSLTINDFTSTEFHGRLAAISLYNLLFALPQFQLNFPFIHGTAHQLETNGYYFFETASAVGLLWRALPIGGLVYAPKLLRQRTRSRRWQLLLTVGLPTVVIPLLLMVMTWESGYALRYSVDFAWQLTLGGLLVCFGMYQRCTSQRMKQFLSVVLVAATVWCMLSTSALVFAVEPGDTVIGDLQLRLEHYRLARMLTFWK